MPDLQPPSASRIQESRPSLVSTQVSRHPQPFFGRTQRSPGLQPPPLCELRTPLLPKSRRAGPLGSSQAPSPVTLRLCALSAIKIALAKPQAVTPPGARPCFGAVPAPRHPADTQRPHSVLGLTYHRSPGPGSAQLAGQETQQSRPGYTSPPRTPPPLSRACRVARPRAVCAATFRVWARQGRS